MHHKLQLSRGSQRYVLCAKPTLNSEIAQRFDDAVVARQFLGRFDINASTLQRFASNLPNYSRWMRGGKGRTPYAFVAQALAQGVVSAFPAHKAANNVLAVSQHASGSRFRLVMACDTGLDSIKALSLKDARAQLEKMNLSDETHAALLKALSLPSTDGALEQALADGKLVISEEQPLHMPTPSESQTAPPRPADKPVTPPPASPTQKETQADDDPIDQEAQAEALKQAAEDGAPFCEECEKPEPQPAEAMQSETPTEDAASSQTVTEGSEASADMPAAVVEPEEKTSWLEFTLEDNLGNPVASQRYEITDAEGNVHEGTTAEDGSARIDILAEGECSLAFPELKEE